MRDLSEELHIYHPYNDQEERDRIVILRNLHDYPNIYERENFYGHITSSPWIVNADATKVLMVYHNRYHSWSWCGGHCDGAKDLGRVALREGQEESGLTSLRLVSEDIFAIDMLPVLSHIRRGVCVAAHVHLNITYLCTANEHDLLRAKKDENSAVQWISIEDIHNIVSESHMKVVYQKLIEKTQRYLLTR